MNSDGVRCEVWSVRVLIVSVWGVRCGVLRCNL